MVDRGRIGRSCGVVWLFSVGACMLAFWEGLVVVNLWTRVRRQFDIRCPRLVLVRVRVLTEFMGVWLVSGGCLYVGVLGKNLVVVIL